MAFLLLPLSVLLKALYSLQTCLLAFGKQLLRSEAPLVQLGPALGRDKQAQIHFPDCNTGDSGRVDSCSLNGTLVVPDKEKHGSFQRIAMCGHTYKQTLPGPSVVLE